jgi:hypothetical protein
MANLSISPTPSKPTPSKPTPSKPTPFKPTPSPLSKSASRRVKHQITTAKASESKRRKVDTIDLTGKEEMDIISDRKESSDEEEDDDNGALSRSRSWRL